MQFRDPFPQLRQGVAAFVLSMVMMISPRSLDEVCKTRTPGALSGIVICAFAVSLSVFVFDVSSFDTPIFGGMTQLLLSLLTIYLERNPN
jgi:hypothetical protein